MRVVIVGRGGREHALAQKFKESSRVQQVYVCPGNPGIESTGIACKSTSSDKALVDFCLQEKIDVVVLGPETAILSDLKALLQEHHIFCVAPDQAAARLESSKEFCKEILVAAGLLTATYQVASSVEEAFAFLSPLDASTSVVIKADGLAQGKGVAVCENIADAKKAVMNLGQEFGFPLLIEECLLGRELSAFALCEDEDFVILGTACDYKRIQPDPFSANTGGMGAYSPCDFITDEDHLKIKEIFTQTLRVLKQKNIPYRGFLFAGLMKCSQGLYVLEFNVRMGDPETQALLPRLKTDWGELIEKLQQGQLRDFHLEEENKTVVHVVATSEGYPTAKMSLGHVITLPASIANNARIYFSGVSQDSHSKNSHLISRLINAGGRVLGVSAMAASKQQAAQQAYAVLQQIHFDKMYYRQDIGQ